MVRYSTEARQKAVALRAAGYSYTEISQELGSDIPKATLYHWFRLIRPTRAGSKKIEARRSNSLKLAREASVQARTERRKTYFSEKEARNTSLFKDLSSDSVRKIILATLYLAEGTKGSRGSITFGNSDPGIVSLFLDLFRATYIIDESKFRCTLQAREDQNIQELEHFWSEITGIPPSRFYKARIDPRSIGKVSRKKEYKGVCRIDYFSSDLLYELMVIGNLLKEGPVAQLVERANGIREVGGS